MERERKERTFAKQHVEPRVADPEIEQNVEYAAQVPEDRSQTFLRLKGDMEERVSADTVGTTDRFFQRVPADEYWPSEHSDGSTFSYAEWERYRNYWKAQGMTWVPAHPGQEYDEGIPMTLALMQTRAKGRHRQLSLQGKPIPVLLKRYEVI